MRILVTGAGGFLGGAAVRRLAANHDVVATDLHLPDDIAGRAGDLADPRFVASLFDRPCDAVVHLATIPGGAAERDPARAWTVNVEATRTLAAHAAVQRSRPRFVFASSIAVFGETDPHHAIDDDTALAPTMLYGAHKALSEAWLATLTRRGEIAALALRLPAIVARPGDGDSFASAFMSTVFHAIADGRRAVLPVSPAATMWLLSVEQAAAGLAHALTIDDAAMPPSRAITLPALHMSMARLVDAIAVHAGRDPIVDYAPNEAIERGFGALPPLAAAAATALGFAHDGDPATLVARVLGDR